MAKCFNLLLECKLFVEHISTKIIVANYGWQFIIFCLKVMQVRDFMVRTFEACQKMLNLLHDFGKVTQNPLTCSRTLGTATVGNCSAIRGVVTACPIITGFFRGRVAANHIAPADIIIL